MAEDILVTLGNGIKQIRKSKGLTQEKLSTISGVSVRHISNIEKGDMNPSFVILYQLVIALDISLDYLFSLPLEKEDANIRQFSYFYKNCPQKFKKVLFSTIQTLAREIQELEQSKDS